MALRAGDTAERSSLNFLEYNSEQQYIFHLRKIF